MQTMLYVIALRPDCYAIAIAHASFFLVSFYVSFTRLWNSYMAVEAQYSAALNVQKGVSPLFLASIEADQKESSQLFHSQSTQALKRHGDKAS